MSHVMSQCRYLPDSTWLKSYANLSVEPKHSLIIRCGQSCFSASDLWIEIYMCEGICARISINF